MGFHLTAFGKLHALVLGCQIVMPYRRTDVWYCHGVQLRDFIPGLPGAVTFFFNDKDVIACDLKLAHIV